MCRFPGKRIGSDRETTESGKEAVHVHNIDTATLSNVYVDRNTQVM